MSSQPIHNIRKLSRGEAVTILPQTVSASQELTSREARNIVIRQSETRDTTTFNHHAMIKQTETEAVESGISALS